jgi:hypothetical protein
MGARLLSFATIASMLRMHRISQVLPLHINGVTATPGGSGYAIRAIIERTPPQ